MLKSCNYPLQEQSNKAESLVRLNDSIANAAEALGRLAGEELRGAQAEHLEEEAAAKVCKLAAATHRHAEAVDGTLPYAVCCTCAWQSCDIASSWQTVCLCRSLRAERTGASM